MHVKVMPARIPAHLKKANQYVDSCTRGDQLGQINVCGSTGPVAARWWVLNSDLQVLDGLCGISVQAALSLWEFSILNSGLRNHQ